VARRSKKRKKSLLLYLLIGLLLFGGVAFLALGAYTGFNFKDMKDLITFQKSIPVYNRTRSSRRNDRVKPVITLKGPTSMTIEKGNPWKEPGYKAWDNKDGNITRRVNVNGEVNTETLGIYQIYYNVKDRAGNVADTKVRRIEVIKRMYQ